MSSDDIVRAVRLRFIESLRPDPVFAHIPPGRVTRSELFQARRRDRRRFRTLLESTQFQHLIQGFLKAHVVDPAAELYSLITWLKVLDSFMKGNTPQQLAQSVEAQSQARSQIVSTLRSVAPPLSDEYAHRVLKLADEIESDILAIRGYEIGGHIINIANIGRRGAAATLAEGAWRGLFIRELRDRLPAIEYFKPDEYALMAHLLSWAGVKGVSSTLVRSVLGRGRT